MVQKPYKFYTNKEYVLREGQKSSIVKLNAKECIFLANKLVRTSKSGKAMSFFLPPQFEFKLHTYKYKEDGKVVLEEVKVAGDETEMIKSPEVFEKILKDTKETKGYFLDVTNDSPYAKQL